MLDTYHLPDFSVIFALLIVVYTSIERNVARILIWVSVWLLLHYASIPILELYSFLFKPLVKLISSVRNNPNTRKLSNLRRLVRSQIYCAFAVSVGFYLLATEYSISGWPNKLLKHWNPWNEYIFEIVIAHWLVSLYEDEITDIEIISHLIVYPGKTPLSLLLMYISH